MAEPVDPETVRVANYVGSPGIGLWLNSFDDDGNAIGYTYTIFNAAAPFNEFGFPAIWAGREELGTDASYKVSLYKYDGLAETSLAGEPLFTETIRQNGDNGYGAIFPMGKTVPAGKYLIHVAQLTGLNGDARPYIVLPTGLSSRSATYFQYFGTANGLLCFYVDFIKTDGIEDYFLPINNDGGIIYVADETVTVIKNTSSNPHALDVNETVAILTDTIPDDRMLANVTISSAPTWSNPGGGSDLSYEVYVWKKNYETTVSGNAVARGTIRDHSDNAPLPMHFGYDLTGGQRYLLVMKKAGTMNIGFWQGDGDILEPNWQIFQNGQPSDLKPGFTYTLMYSVEVEPVPTDSPGSETGPSPTASPASPGAPSSTPSPTQNPQKTGCNSSFTPLPSALIIVVFFLFLLSKKPDANTSEIPSKRPHFFV